MGGKKREEIIITIKKKLSKILALFSFQIPFILHLATNFFPTKGLAA